jgi:hypothetical protein
VYDSVGKNQAVRFGLIAQEVSTIMPEAVYEQDEKLMVSYDKLRQYFRASKGFRHALMIWKNKSPPSEGDDRRMARVLVFSVAHYSRS